MNNRLTYKLGVRIALVTSLIITASALAVFSISRHAAVQSLRLTLSTRADALATILREPVETFADKTISDILKAELAEQNVVALSLTEPSGKILAALQSDGPGAGGEVPRIDSRPGYIVFSRPIHAPRDPNRVYAIINVYGDESRAALEAVESATINVFLLIGLAIVVVIAVFTMLQRDLLRPFEKLRQRIVTVGRQATLEKPIGEAGNGFADPVPLTGALAELVAMASAFEATAARLVAAQAESVANERRFRAVFDAAFEQMTVMDPRGVIIEANQMAVRSAGVRHAELLGRFFWESCWPGMSAELKAQLRHAVERGGRGETVRLTVEHGTNHQDRICVDFSIKPVTDARGSVMMLVVEGHDDTARRRAVSERLQLQEELAQAQKLESIGRLAGGVAHDFNNLLTVIHGNIDLLDPAEIALLGESGKNLHDIKAAASRATQLTNQLLVFSRKQVLDVKPADLNQILTGFGSMLKRLIPENILIERRLAEDIWPVSVDAAQIEQVILNLALNARDAMPEGGTIVLETSNHTGRPDLGNSLHREPDVDWVCLGVADNGAGMDEITKQNLFVPFFTTKAVGKGTGLGLSTVYGIVKQHQGVIACESEPKKGTVFRVYLPRHHGSIVPAQVAEVQVTSGVGETILVVEDDDQVRRVTARILRSSGYHVVEASSGPEAIEWARKGERLDLLLTDLVMPGMNGSETRKALEALRPQIRTIYCSGYSGTAVDFPESMAEWGSFLQKPFTTETLLHQVRKELDRGPR